MKKLLPSLLILFFAYSCLSSNDTFLIDNLDNKKKSELITDKGIEKFKTEIEQKENYSNTDEIKKYFIVAISYDKSNTTALDYIKKIDSLNQYLFNKMYKTSLYYKDIKNKKIIDEYNMCYYLERALEIDQNNKNALKMKKNIKDSYDRVIKYYLNYGITLKTKINNTKNESVKNSLYIQAYTNYNRITLIDSYNSTAKKELDYYDSEISKIISSDLKNLNTKVKNGKYEDVYYSLNTLDQNNSIIKNKFNREILDLKYQLFYNWGINLYKKNKLQLALYKINSALSIKYDNYLNTLRNKITDSLNTEFFKNSFESLLDDIDESIDSGKLDIAKSKIDGVKDSVKNDSQKKELEDRMKKITDKIPEIYDSAVNDYNEENFSTAIKKLQIIYKIDPKYKEVKNYLDKATEKQKVLENY